MMQVKDNKENCSNRKIYISEKSKILFHDLIIRKEYDSYIIGRKDTTSYASVSRIGLEIINLLKKQLSISDVKKSLSNKYNDEIIIEEFIESLILKGFVSKIDGEEIEDEEKFEETFKKLKKEQVQWLFSKPAFLLYSFTSVIALFIIFFNHQYIPNYQDFFFNEWLTVVIVATFIIGWILVFKHELFHLFAAKSVGINANFSISHRLYFLVCQTDVTNLWSIDRKKRYLVHLSGLMIDVFFISLLFIFLFLSDIDILPYNEALYKICKLIILLEFFGIVFQFQFYIKTDIYYLIANLFKCKNLMDDSITFIKNCLHRFFPKKIKYTNQNHIPDYEIKVIKIYSILMLAGTFLIILVFLFYGLPMSLVVINDYILKIVNGININSRYLADGISLILISIINLELLTYSFYKKRKERVDKTSKKPEIIWI